MAGKKKSRRFRNIDDPEAEFLDLKKEDITEEAELDLWQQYLSGEYVPAKAAKVSKARNVDLPVDVKAKASEPIAKFKKIKQGKIKFDKVLDLHGLTLVQAESAINKLVADAYDKQKRLLKIITGKGKNSSGKLKKYAPDILSNIHNRPKIIAVMHAPTNAGGEGVLYVMIKKKRD